MIETKSFLLAGNATLTVTSKATGTRFTYKARASKDGQRHYVSLMNGPDNEADFRFFGTIFADGSFRHGRPDKTTITPDAPSAKAFNFLWKHIDGRPFRQTSTGSIVTLADVVEVHHEGKCCRCGRKLTVPRSVELGLGAECAEAMGVSF